MKHTNNFHLLRLLLALLVLLAHALELRADDSAREIPYRLFQAVTLGSLAVAAFFILSGYLITQSWDRRAEVVPFLRNRVLRIYPGFIVASLLSLLVAGWLTGAPGFFSALQPTHVLRELALLRMPASLPVYPDQPLQYVNASIWTIVYEFRCYVLVLLLGLAGCVKNRLWVLGFWGAFLALTLWPQTKFFLKAHWLNVIFGYSDYSVKLGGFFLGGAVCYLFREKLAFTRSKILFAAAILVPALFWNASSDFAVGTVGAYLLVALAFWQLPLLARLVPRYDISYGVYLYGWPVQKAIQWRWPTISAWTLFFWSTVISCACGAISWLVVERPFLKLKKNRPLDVLQTTQGATTADSVAG